MGMGSACNTVVVVVVVEVCFARNLMPKDGRGSASAFVEVVLDSKRKRTKTAYRDLNPVWNEQLLFRISNPSLLQDEALEINLYNDRKNSRGNFLGRVRIAAKSALIPEDQASVVCYQLDKRSLFSSVRGEVALRIFCRDQAEQHSAPFPISSSSTQGSVSTRYEEGSSSVPIVAAAEEENQEIDQTLSASSSSSEEKEGGVDLQEYIHYTQHRIIEPKKVHQKRGGSYDFPKSASSSSSSSLHATTASMTAGGAGGAANAPSDFNLKETRPKLAATAKRGGNMLKYSERSRTYDLVERMEYLYVKVVKAKGLAAKDAANSSSDPYVLIKVGSLTAKTRAIDKSLSPEWNQVFAFAKDKFQAPSLELTVKDKDAVKDDFLGSVSFDIAEVPMRVPPDSPLAPQWYKLENNNKKGGGTASSSSDLGEIMVSVWRGTQADEAFPEAWQSDSGGHPLAKSKVYLSPRLWYLRVSVIEAQDLLLSSTTTEKSRLPDVRVKAQLGFQVAHTRTSANRSNNPTWNEDLLFVAAEPFEDPLILTVEDRVGAGGGGGNNNKDQVVLGKIQIAVSSVQKRSDHRHVSSRWFNLEKQEVPPPAAAAAEKTIEGSSQTPPKPPKDSSSKFMSRVHLRVCLDGGYHVLDESTHYSSDLRPSAKEVWKAPVGILELGILGGTGLLPMKNKGAGGTTDAYVVAKYGQKWVRSRTVVDSFFPRWNEQYTWEVYDPCTVLTVGMFDNSHLGGGGGAANKDARIGKVRIRLSTLESDRVYTHSYPLLLLQPSGVKKMGEVELAVRFSTCSSTLNVLACYSRPLLPKMHYLHPIGVAQLELLRNHAMKIVAARLARSEPPFRTEVVQYMLDVDSNLWSMRKSKANWFRIIAVLSGIIAVARWFSDICLWKNPLTTVLVHFLFLILLMYPELILPTLFLYMFLIGAWHYRFRPRYPPHMDTRMSQADGADPDELDEEFDSIPTSKSQEVVKARYDRLRAVSGRIQTVLGDMATQGERLQALLSWRDPRATAIFILFCLLSALLLYVTPFRIVALLIGFYVLRHPRFRNKLPSAHINFFRRLPALSDRLL